VHDKRYDSFAGFTLFCIAINGEEPIVEPSLGFLSNV
jgi:hypothetical protein